MHKDIWKRLIIPSILLILFFASLMIFRSETWSTIILLGCLTITFALTHQRREWLLFLIGTLLGIIMEIGGDMVYQLQYWNTDSPLGVPLWLPLLWGFQFVIVYRLGTLIVSEKKKD